MSVQVNSLSSSMDVSWVRWGFHAATFRLHASWSFCVSVSALVLQLLEYLNDLPAEIEFFTNTPKRPLTYLYAWSRYFGLVAQVTTLALNELSNHHASWRLCMITFIARGICSQLMISCIEAILMIRVHALYSCSRGMGRALSVIFLVGTLLEVAGTALAIHDTRPSHAPTELPQLSSSGEVCGTTPLHPAPLLLFALGCAFVQGTIVLSMLRKVFITRRSRWYRTPVGSLMVRDGIAFFIVLAAVLSTIIGFEIAKGQGPLMWNVTTAWFIALLSVGGCRLILNMRRLAISPSSINSENTSMDELSTVIEFDTTSCSDL